MVMSESNLQAVIDKAVDSCLEKFADRKLQASELAVCLVDMQDSESLGFAGYRQEVEIFPASLVKLFYAVAVCHWLGQGKLVKTAELDRSMRDMLADSSNDATAYIVDLLTGTTSGPELDEAEFCQWSAKRNCINEFFRSFGYQDINVNQKTWGDGPYGRERDFLGAAFENRNKLTARSTARLLVDIALGKAALPQYCQELLKYMERDRSKPSTGVDDQAHGFIGAILPPGARFWSKSGWTSTVRHDAIFFHLDDRSRYCLVVFTENHAQQRDILSSVGLEIISSLVAAAGPCCHG